MLPNLLTTIFPKPKANRPAGAMSLDTVAGQTPGVYPGSSPSGPMTRDEWRNQEGAPIGEPATSLRNWNPERFTGLQVDESLGRDASTIYPVAKQPDTTEPVRSQTATDYEAASGVPLSQPNPGVFPRSSRQKQDEFEARYKTMTPEQQQQSLSEGKAPVEHSVLKRALKGALRGFGMGGIGGAITGAAAEGFFPSANRQMNAKEEFGKVSTQIKTRQNQQTSLGKIEKQAHENAKAEAESVIKQLEAVRAQNPELVKFIEKKGYIDAQDQKMFREAGYGYVPQVDFRKFDTKEIGGTTYATPEVGAPNYQKTNAPVDRPKEVTDFQTGAGIFPVSNEKAAGYATDIDANNARMTQQANIENTKNAIGVAKTNETNLAKWHSDRLDLQLKAVAASGANLSNAAELQGLTSQMSGLKNRLYQMEADANAPTTDPEVAEKLRTEWRKEANSYIELQGKFDAAAGKTKAGEQMLAEIQKASPPKPKTLSAPEIAPVKVGGKTVPKSKDPLGLFQ